MPSCPFCEPARDRIFHDGELVLGLWDAYPLAPGHALLVPRRHIADWFDATETEQLALLRALDVARTEIVSRHAADGFNVGINIGAAAGQTVPHLHLHLIPRVTGDVADPRGGVRWVLAERAAWWKSSHE